MQVKFITHPRQQKHRHREGPDPCARQPQGDHHDLHPGRRHEMHLPHHDAPLRRARRGLPPDQQGRRLHGRARIGAGGHEGGSPRDCRSRRGSGARSRDREQDRRRDFHLQLLRLLLPGLHDADLGRREALRSQPLPSRSQRGPVQRLRHVRGALLVRRHRRRGGRPVGRRRREVPGVRSLCRRLPPGRPGDGRDQKARLHSGVTTPGGTGGHPDGRNA